MKTVYDFFLDFYKLKQTDFFRNGEVEAGIEYYLRTLLLYDVYENAEQIATMELARFKYMDNETFEMFFNKYEIRYEIETIVRESKILAVSRTISGEVVEKESCQSKLNKFYNLITSFSNDKRYSSWIEKVTEEIIYCLKYASGETDCLIEEFLD